jgi:hypothetical protein
LQRPVRCRDALVRIFEPANTEHAAVNLRRHAWELHA